MSEWLTTGQMIDRLKVGEVAESNQNSFLPVKRFESGIYWVDTKTHERVTYHKNPMTLSNEKLNFKWRILPKYVSFEEAMKALKEGKIIEMYSNKTGMPFRFKKEADAIFHVFANMKMDFRDLIDGKWTIEEES